MRNRQRYASTAALPGDRACGFARAEGFRRSDEQRHQPQNASETGLGGCLCPQHACRACTSNGAGGANGASGGGVTTVSAQLTIGSPQKILTLDPALAADGYSEGVLHEIGGNLYELGS